MSDLPSSFFDIYKQVYAETLAEHNRQFPGRVCRIVLENVTGSLAFYTIQCYDRFGKPAVQIGNFNIAQHADDVLLLCGFRSRPKEDYLVWHHPDYWGF